MCVSDWRLGRFLRSDSTLFSITSGNTGSLALGDDLVGLNICLQAPGASAATGAIVLAGGNAVAFLNNNLCQVMYTLPIHGDLLRKAWTLQASGQNITGSVTAWYLPKEVLNEELDRFYSEYMKWRG